MMTSTAERRRSGMMIGFTVDGVLRITPVRGMVLVFHHPIWHRCDPVTAGRNYVLRTDVMYRRSS
jgi:hypothetical protein